MVKQFHDELALNFDLTLPWFLLKDEVNEWHAMLDVEVCRADKFLFTGECPEDSDEDHKKKLIRAKLKVSRGDPFSTD